MRRIRCNHCHYIIKREEMPTHVCYSGYPNVLDHGFTPVDPVTPNLMYGFQDMFMANCLVCNKEELYDKAAVGRINPFDLKLSQVHPYPHLQ